MENKPIMMTANEVASILGCKSSTAYKIIRQMNK